MKRKRSDNGGGKRDVPKKQRQKSVARTGGNFNSVQMTRGGVGTQGGELKFIDVNTNDFTGFKPLAETSGTDSTGAASLALLNGVALGTDATQRIGRKTTMKSIYLRCGITSRTTNSTPTNGFVTVPGQIRYLIVYDMQPNGTALTVADVFQQSGVADLMVSPLNLNNRDRFRVLTDKVTSISNSPTASIPAGASDHSRYIKIYKKINLPVIYNAGTAGTVGDIQTGSLYFISFTNCQMNNTPAGGWLLSSFYSRVRFEDK